MVSGVVAHTAQSVFACLACSRSTAPTESPSTKSKSETIPAAGPQGPCGVLSGVALRATMRSTSPTDRISWGPSVRQPAPWAAMYMVPATS